MGNPFLIKYMTEPISRVLLKAIIYLDVGLLRTLQPSFETHRANVWFQLMLHRIGFTWPWCLHHAGELLPRLSTLTTKWWRYLSVALSLRSPSAAVSRYPALRCSDFPHSFLRDCSARSLCYFNRSFSFCQVFSKDKEHTYEPR